MITKVFLVGMRGKLGHSIYECAQSQKNIEIVGGFGLTADSSRNIFCDVKDVNVSFDVIIDTSRPEVLGSVIELARRTKRPVVFATTGYDEKSLERIEALSREIPIFKSGNMSLGINLLIDLVERATRTLSDIADIEIIEKHHKQKVDSPSGTAKMIADACVRAANEKTEFIYGRYGDQIPRKKNDIGIHSVRGGSVIGEHEVGFYLNDEIITLTHSASSRKIFAEGALKAAEFIRDKAPGMYNMKHLLG